MQKSIRFCLAISFLLSTIRGMAENRTVSGVIKDSTGAVATATVSLLEAKDSTWVKSTVTDDKGAFKLTEIPAGVYLISVTALGYTTTILPQAIKDTTNDPILIILQKEHSSLKEVTITGNKPFIEMGIGKLTVNIDASPTATGLNMLEMLRKMPGITVDANGNISMMGKNGVLVMIDDRPTYLSADQLADYLKTIPSDEIAQVELITQPSAKYDAAGNAGIINLKRKKSRKEGWYVTATGTYGEGVYPFFLGSALINYHKKKFNISLTGNETNAIGFAHWTETQSLYDPNTGTNSSITNITSVAKEHFSIANARLAADYNITDKESIGISIKGGYHTNSDVDNVYSNTFDILNNSTTYNNIIAPNGFIREDMSINAFYTCKFNNDRNLNINLDYLIYYNSPYQTINNTDFDAQMQPQPNPLLLQSHQPSQIDVYSVKGDYTDTLNNGIKLEAGFKSSLVTTNNNAEFTIFQNNAWINDTTRSNRFLYKENINALYLSAGKHLGNKWDARIGIRTENTNTQGVQQVHEQESSKSYISLFPTAYIDYKYDKNNQFELNYGRRIDRPSYQSLNPFIYYSFQYNYSVGNPYLQPEYTNSIELKHSYKNILITTLSVTNTTGVMSDILVPNNNTGVVYSTKANIGTNNAFNASEVFNKDLTKWWSLNAYMVFFYAHYNGMVDNYKLNVTGTGFFTGMSNQLNFKKGWKAEADINYAGKFIESIISTSLPSLYIGMGATKKINGSNTIKLSVQDPFYINMYRNTTSLPGLQTSAVFRNNTRNIQLAYTYTFGNNSSKNHEADAIDESKRIK